MSAEEVRAAATGISELPPRFAAGEVEARLYARWVALGVFTPPPEPTGPPYCLVIPPPNVTAALHIGHAFGMTLMDILTRHRRMCGDDVLWLPGTDHAGIATQNVVERELADEGVSRFDLGREAFVERVWAWKHEYGGRIGEQIRRLGSGVDWTRERFTMDEGLSRAVRRMFVSLYDQGLIYRAERIINWCPRCLTALSDIEVSHRESDGELVTVSYGPLAVATTRVETMLGDTAVAVHPDDERYRHLVGSVVTLPLVGRQIPVVADAAVDPAFGTGAVKVTPAHDPNDFEIGLRHQLPAPVVLDDHAVVTAPGGFAGLDRFAARQAVRETLEAAGLVVDRVAPYRHSVGHCSRCDTVVEPRLSLQWYVRVAPLAGPAGQAVRDGRVVIHPPELARRYFDWVDHMHDWCISRQLWWGHRIPVWYCPEGHESVAETDPSACAMCSSTELRQDEDVLDTWFSSALWPFSTLGWPDRTADLARFYPTAVLVTGYDIIFFWVARMMMFGLYAMDGQPPFRTVVLHGLVRDERGRKMSKSAGNGVDPLEWIATYGADAVRFSFARGAHPGVDVSVGEEWVRGSRNFVTKLWNAARFAIASGAGVPSAAGPQAAAHDAASAHDVAPAAPADRWILGALGRLVAEVDTDLAGYEFARACEALYHFTWDELCSWYLELAKVRLRAGGPPAQRVRHTLRVVFDALLRLLHPVMPFVTEELWTALTGGETIVVAAWPDAADYPEDPQADAEIERLKVLVGEVRRFRTEQGLADGVRVPAVLSPEVPALGAHAAELGALTALDVALATDIPTGWATLAAGGVRLGIDPTVGLDVAAESARLGRELAEATAERDRHAAKLASPAFVERAPAPVVSATRERQAAAEALVTALTDRLARLGQTSR